MTIDHVDHNFRTLFHTPYVTRDPYEVEFLGKLICREHPEVSEEAVAAAMKHCLDVMRPPRPLSLFLVKVEEELRNANGAAPKE